MFKDTRQCATSHFIVTDMVAKFTKLVENKILRVEFHFVTRIVNFFDIALGARRTHDVTRVTHPFVEPIKSLLRHSRWQNCNSTRPHDAADRNATTRIISCRRPNCTVSTRVELPSNYSWRKTRIRCQYFVRGNHRKPITKHHDYRACDASQTAGQHHMVWH